METFASAQEFLSRPRALIPNCLVLDVYLPGLNGLDLQRASLPIELPCRLFLSLGYGDIPTSVEAMKAGAVEFLTKPFGHEVLLTAIRSALERARSGLATKRAKSAA